MSTQLKVRPDPVPPAPKSPAPKSPATESPATESQIPESPAVASRTVKTPAVESRTDVVDRVAPERMRGVRVDAATVCQLRCPSCPTAKGKMAQFVGDGWLRFDDFRELVDRNPWVRSIELSNWGEMFLNPDLARIVEYAHRKDVELTAVNGVNLNTAREEALEAVARYRFREMVVSLDGASDETYAKYRVRGTFSKVIENVRKINEYKRVHASPAPKLWWQFVVFGHNEHEIPEAKRMAAELDMGIYFKLSWDEKFSPPRDHEFVKREAGLDATTRSEFEALHGRRYLQVDLCAQIWRHPQVNFDGRILGCCVNRWGDFGRAEGWQLREAVNNDKLRHARRMLMGAAGPREDIPCTTCSYYHSLRDSGAWLTPDEVL